MDYSTLVIVIIFIVFMLVMHRGGGGGCGVGKHPKGQGKKGEDGCGHSEK